MGRRLSKIVRCRHLEKKVLQCTGLTNLSVNTSWCQGLSILVGSSGHRLEVEDEIANLSKELVLGNVPIDTRAGDIGVDIHEGNSSKGLASLDDGPVIGITDELCEVVLDDGSADLVGTGWEVNQSWANGSASAVLATSVTIHDGSIDCFLGVIGPSVVGPVVQDVSVNDIVVLGQWSLLNNEVSISFHGLGWIAPETHLSMGAKSGKPKGIVVVSSNQSIAGSSLLLGQLLHVAFKATRVGSDRTAIFACKSITVGQTNCLDMWVESWINLLLLGATPRALSVCNLASGEGSAGIRPVSSEG